MRKTFNMSSAMAQIVDQPALDLTFAELIQAYCAVRCDDTDVRTKKWVEAFGPSSAWEISTEELTRAHQAMVAHGYSAAAANRDVSAIGIRCWPGCSASFAVMALSAATPWPTYACTTRATWPGTLPYCWQRNSRAKTFGSMPSTLGSPRPTSMASRASARLSGRRRSWRSTRPWMLQAQPEDSLPRVECFPGEW